MVSMKKTAVAAAVILAMGVGAAAQAAPVVTTNTTFQMYDPSGAAMAPDNTVTHTYDTAAMTWGVASTTSFFGLTWTASNGVLYNPGTYTININADGGNAAECTYNVSTCNAPLANGDGFYTFTVPTGSLGGNIKFAWGATTGIDVFMVWSADGTTSLDSDGDGTPGARMVDGPFPGFSANFTPGAPVPVPAAVWLFGSGLLGLVGIARRKKKA
mgnify:CR=1 FL=1